MPWVAVVQVRQLSTTAWSDPRGIEFTRGWPWRDGHYSSAVRPCTHAWSLLDAMHARHSPSSDHVAASLSHHHQMIKRASGSSSRRPSSSLASSLRSQTISYYYRRRPNNVQFPSSLADLVAVDLMHGVVFSSLHQPFHSWRVPSSSFIGTELLARAYYRSFYWN